MKWDSLNKGALTKTFFPVVKDRLSKRLQMCSNLSAVVTGHGKLRSYLHRFKIIEDPMCPCKMNPQTSDHLIRECALLSKHRQIHKSSIIKVGGRWPTSSFDLANKYTNLFQNLWMLSILKSCNSTTTLTDFRSVACIYIYIYIYRERERERERERASLC